MVRITFYFIIIICAQLPISIFMRREKIVHLSICLGKLKS